MTAQEAWALVRLAIEDVDVRTAIETNDYFVFSLKPAGINDAVAGIAMVSVNKRNGKIEGCSPDEKKSREARK